MLKTLFKRILYRVAPQATTAVMSARARAHAHRFLARVGVPDLNRRLLARFGNRVLTGPFAGMALTPMTYAEQIGPFLLGSFEAELHPWVSGLLARPLRQVIDVGSAFGYYAVGFARRLPAAAVVAFDTDWWARRAADEMAAANGVTNLTLRGYCRPADLVRLLAPPALVFSDCEGFEAHLFLASPAEVFADTALLVEVHETAAPGVTGQLRGRFAATHVAEAVSCGDRALPGVDLSWLSPADRERAMYEIRGPQEWLLFTPKHWLAAGDPVR